MQLLLHQHEAHLGLRLSQCTYPSCGFLIGLSNELTLSVTSLGQHLNQRLFCRAYKNKRTTQDRLTTHTALGGFYGFTTYRYLLTDGISKMR